jgi:hypothetical protein
MTRDDIIRMAREAGAGMLHGGEYSLFGDTAIERFAALVAAEEREQCAKICDEVNKEYDGEEVSASWIAVAIRARGNNV